VQAAIRIIDKKELCPAFMTKMFLYETGDFSSHDGNTWLPVKIRETQLFLQKFRLDGLDADLTPPAVEGGPVG